MTSLWPWVVVAGAGALHGLMPSSGWMLAAACGVHSRDGRQALRALVPIAVGHVASIALVAAVVALGLSMDPLPLQVLSCALLGVVVLRCVSRRRAPLRSAPAGRIGLALWSFMASTMHGTGMMLVPALIPLCVSDSPAKEITASGSMLLAIAAVGVHTAAMLTVTAVFALGACRSIFWARLQIGALKVRVRSWLTRHTKSVRRGASPRAHPLAPCRAPCRVVSPPQR
jgi:hypothetical protein